MLDAARQALVYAEGATRATLNTNEMLVHSLVRMIEIIGEAASQVSAEYKQAHPELPWKSMTNMRNHLIHAYFDVDLNRVWKTVEEDAPQLIAQLERIVPAE